ncbi:MAG: O-antigen ligase family protein [Roseibium sp.]|uniref:O-antigen ligase family protein n=1 Tax=Roseibium sp. TaxID=1936156 RepID=UPI001B10197D|nr:O-antigen ligase family protein [Roseibium sp.]MBO6895240.1 O-antigen ligase family protein [Roseibium sp.]MBO6933041.1 O-antigen ligase family protein [Roseibium sp.]
MTLRAIPLAQPIHGPVRTRDFPLRSTMLAALATLIPALLLTDPMLVWPLLYAEQQAAQAGALLSRGVYTTFVLHKIWIPPLFLMASALFALAWKRVPGFHLATTGWWIATFLWFALTVSWALVPGIAMSRLILQVMIAATLYFAFCASNRPGDILTCIYWLFVATIFLNLAAVLTQTPSPIGYQGIYEHKNYLGAVVALGFFFVLWKCGTGERLHLLVAAVALPVCLFLLVMSQSKTSAGLLFISLGLGTVSAFFARFLRMPAILTFLLALVAVVFVILFVNAMFGLPLTRQIELLTGDATFTGRTGLWVFTLEHFGNRPLHGFGFRSFWDIGDASPSLRTGMGFLSTATAAHSGYLDIMLNGGWIALLLFMPVLLIALQLCGRIARKDLFEGTMLSTILYFFIFHNMLETTFFYGAHALFVLFQIVWLYIIFTAPRRSSGRSDKRHFKA